MLYIVVCIIMSLLADETIRFANVTDDAKNIETSGDGR